MIIDSTDSLRDLPSDENGTKTVPGFPLEALTGQEPAAMEGRVQADERSEEPGRGSLDAPRAAGMSRDVGRPLPAGSGEGSITPLHLHSQDGYVRAVCPLTIDGYTRLEVRVPTPSDGLEGRQLSEEALGLIESLTGWEQPHDKGEALPMPFELSQGVLRGPVVADWEVSGKRNPEIRIHVHGAVHIRWNVERGRVNVQAKAPYLWWAGGGCTGWERWAMDWVVALHRFFFDETIELSEAHSRGWNVTGVEICKDLVGLRDWTMDDTENFLGGSKTHVISSSGKVETLNVGLRATSSVSLTLYNKTKCVEDKGEDASLYERVWRSHGWEGENVQRAELRLRDKALKYAEGPNLRDPAVLCDESVINEVWCHEMKRKRLVVPVQSAKRNCPTDPQWEPIMEGDHGLVVVDLEQDRSPAEGAHQWRTKRNDGQLIDAAARVCAMRGLVERPRTMHELFRTLELAMTRTEVDALNRFHNRLRAYSETQRMWLGDEIDAARRSLKRPARGGLVYRRAS